MRSGPLIPIFLSVGEPHNEVQKKYLEDLIHYFKINGIRAETLGRSFWSIKNPLNPIQKKMNEVYGACILAMNRFHSIQGIYKEGSDDEKKFGGQYYASIWTQIEAAMAYQNELPLLILKEEMLLGEGMFDPGIHEWMIIRIHPDDLNELKKDPIKSFIDSWIEEVRKRYYSSINEK